MYVVRNVFKCKPGKAGELAKKMRETRPLMQKLGAGNSRVMVDAVASFWTVVSEIEVSDLAAWEKALNDRAANEEMGKAMAGYMDLVEGGYREVFRLVE